MPADDVTMLKKLSLPKIRKLGFKYQLIAPSIIILLIIGLFPLVYTLVVSFQGITMMDNDTSFHGIKNYVAIADDTRFWGALFHTVMFTVIALPIELFLGLFMAQLFIEKLPGRQIFIALLVPGCSRTNRLWRHLVVAPRQSIRTHQSNYQLVHGRRTDTVMDYQSDISVSRNFLSGGMAMDTLYVLTTARSTLGGRQGPT